MNNKKLKKFGFHTQNPRRFPGFTFVVVTVFVEILNDVHDFVSECVSFQKEINIQFVVVQRQGLWSRQWHAQKFENKQTHTFYLRKSNEKIAQVSSSYNKYSLRTINHSTTKLLIPSVPFFLRHLLRMDLTHPSRSSSALKKSPAGRGRTGCFGSGRRNRFCSRLSMQSFSCRFSKILRRRWWNSCQTCSSS